MSVLLDMPTFMTGLYKPLVREGHDVWYGIDMREKGTFRVRTSQSLRDLVLTPDEIAEERIETSVCIQGKSLSKFLHEITALDFADGVSDWILETSKTDLKVVGTCTCGCGHTATLVLKGLPPNDRRFQDPELN